LSTWRSTKSTSLKNLRKKHYTLISTLLKSNSSPPIIKIIIFNFHKIETSTKTLAIFWRRCLRLCHPSAGVQSNACAILTCKASKFRTIYMSKNSKRKEQIFIYFKKSSRMPQFESDLHKMEHK
jgi:hypothetical protein